MHEDIRLELHFCPERDGWLYEAVRNHLDGVKQRNRGLKLKQLIAAALSNAGASPAMGIALSIPTMPTAAAVSTKPTLPAASPSSPARANLAEVEQPKTARPSAYGDALNDFHVELPGV